MPRSSLVILSTLVVVLLSAIAGSSCSTAPPSPYGQTLFLGDRVIPGAGAFGQPIQDSSYWRGDGVSGSPSIRLNLSEQRAYFFKDGVLVGESPISSGDAEHRTPTGTFSVTQKNLRHRSNLYGDYVDSGGNVVVANVDSRTDRRPPGTTYRGADMPHFLRFNGGIGMHGGHLPGYPASHGCVRLPYHMAAHFYQHANHGTPVSVIR
ncbi:hypothetical protein BH23VER1_BH23VER1_18160 [soil metagenome]